MASGKTKNDAIWKKPKDKTITKNSKRVTSLKITRNGNKFTASWKNAKTYSSIKIRYRLKVKGKWKSWSSWRSLGRSDTSSEFLTLQWSDYYPTSGKPELHNIEVSVKADQPTTSWETKYEQNSKKVWYKWRERKAYKAKTEECKYDIIEPQKPAMTVESGLNATTFTYSVAKAENDKNTVFRKIEYNTAWVKDWGTKSASTYKNWESAAESSNANGSFTNNHGAGNISGGTSYSALARIRARGPEGDSDYTYSTLCYAWPDKATGIRGTYENKSTGYRVTVSWDKKVTDTKPAALAKVEYYIGTPTGTSYACPSGVQWQDGSDWESNSEKRPSSTFDTNARIQGEQYMWVRVIQKHVQNLQTPSDPVAVVKFSKLIAPSISSVTYDASTHSLSVTVNNESTFNCTNKIYCNGNYIGSVTGSGTLTVNKNIGTKAVTITADSTYGNKTSDKASFGYDPTLSTTNPAPYYPLNVNAKKASESGRVIVTWTPQLKGVTSSVITVADNPNEWDLANPDFVETVTVSGSASTGTIGGLEFETKYYLKVQSTNEHGTTNYSADTASIELKATDAPVPDITNNATETSDHDIKVTWNWDTWSSATQLQLTWSSNKNDGDTDQLSVTTVDKKVSSGKQSYIIPLEKLERGKWWYIWARFVSGRAISKAAEARVNMTITPVAPTNITFVRETQETDEEGKTTARLSWRDTWADTKKTQLSWSIDANAWNKTSGPETYDIDGKASTMLIPDLELGKTYYARVSVFYNDDYYARSAAIVGLDLRTYPNAPVVSLSNAVVSQYGKMDVSWTYYNEDLSEQASASIIIYDENGEEVRRQSVIGTDNAATLYMESLGLAGDAAYSVVVQTASLNGMISDMSSAVEFNVISMPIAEITGTSLVDVTEEELTVKTLTQMPMTINVSGEEHSGTAYVYIERSKAIFLERPDESEVYGFEGELIVTAEAGSDGNILIVQDDLRTEFVDGGEYRIVAIVTNEIGVRSDPATLDFTVHWTHQAIMPEAEYVTDPDNNIAKITPIAPVGTEQTDTFDIYRLSADAPELIVHGGTWGTTYVDPYPAFGDDMGHRIVFRTETGDYTTAEGYLAWLDCIPPFGNSEQPTLTADSSVIDFNGEQVRIEYNMNISHEWEKDFTETKYLGGAVQGDWNPAVSRTGQINGVMVTYENADDIAKMRRLAAFPGICHVRTPDGSSFAANVQVSESRNRDTAGKVVEFSLTITRVDSEGYDGMELAEWEDENGVE